MAGRSRGGQKKPAPRRRGKYLTLIREAPGLFIVQRDSDLGTPERALQEGGVTEGYRRDPVFESRVLKGAVANLPGPFEALVARLTMPADERRLVIEAAQRVRATAQRARLRRRVTGGYLMVTPGSDGINLKAEAREEHAAQRLSRWCGLVGRDAFCALLDLVVFEEAIPRLREGLVIAALNRIAVDLRLSTTSRR